MFYAILFLEFTHIFALGDYQNIESTLWGHFMEPKQNKNYGTSYFALALIVAIFFELYFIMTDPYNYFMLIGIGIVMIITGYLTFDSIERAKRDQQKRADENADMMIKAQKAIYLATKRNSQEAEKQHIQNIKAVELMMNNLISNQKDMVNVMITKNEEIATKQIESKSGNSNDMSSLVDQLSASNAKLAKEVQAAITVNELVKANADLVKNVREVLNSSQTQNMTTEAITDYVSAAVPEIKVAPAPVAPATPVAATPVAAAPVTPVAAPVIEAPVIEEPIIEEPVIETPVFENSVQTLDTAGANDSFDFDELTTKELTEDTNDDQFDFESFEIPENDDSTLEDAPVASDDDIVNDVNASDLQDMVDLEGDTIAPPVSEALDEEMSSDIPEGLFENVNEQNSDTTVTPLDDNPIRQLTEEEIAALFAGL